MDYDNVVRSRSVEVRILLIEDDRTVAEFVQKGLQEAGYSVDHVDNGKDGAIYGSNPYYDLIVADLMLPGMDGFQIIKFLRSQKIQTPILVLSALDTVDDRVRGLRGGADDYLVKPFAFSELLARIQAMLRRVSGSAETTRLTVGDLSLDLLSREAERAGLAIVLQTKEFELLEYLMRNVGMVVSKTMIIEHVWNYNFDPLTNIVEARISRLREKIDKPYETKLIKTVRGAGYILKP
jgi:two-component system OmpR family response regulator